MRATRQQITRKRLLSALLDSGATHGSELIDATQAHMEALYETRMRQVRVLAGILLCIVTIIAAAVLVLVLREVFA